MSDKCATKDSSATYDMSSCPEDISRVWNETDDLAAAAVDPAADDWNIMRCGDIWNGGDTCSGVGTAANPTLTSEQWKVVVNSKYPNFTSTMCANFENNPPYQCTVLQELSLLSIVSQSFALTTTFTGFIWLGINVYLNHCLGGFHVAG